MYIEDFLEHLEEDYDFEYRGEPHETFSGFEYRLRSSDPDNWFIVMHDGWSAKSRKRHRQDEKNISDLIKKCENHGLTKFVVPFSLQEDDTFKDKKCIFVDNTLEFLFKAAEVVRKNCSNGTVFGITGSAGKSSTKAMLTHVMAHHFPDKKIFSPGINQNTWSNVLSHLTKIPLYDCSIIEISSACFTIYPKRGFIPSPDVSIVTSISESHLDYCHSIEGVAEIKSEIFAHHTPDAVAVINSDTSCSDILINRAKKEGCQIIYYGESDGVDARLEKFDFSTGSVEANIFGERVKYTVGAPGKHMALNSLAVICAMIGSGVEDWKDALPHFSTYSSLTGRGQVEKIKVRGGEATLIDESYNANPVSMSATLEFLGNYAETSNGRRIAILGDILELGEDADSIHARLAEKIIEAKVDKIYLVGNHVEKLWLCLPGKMKGALFPTVRGVYSVLRSELKNGDVVLIKSSNGIGLSKLSAKLKGK